MNKPSGFGATGFVKAAALMATLLAFAASAGAECPPGSEGIETDVVRLRDVLVQDRVGATLPQIATVRLNGAGDRLETLRLRESVAGGPTKYVFKWVRDGKKIQAEGSGGVWDVRVDGERVPAGRFDVNNELVIRDADGKEIFREPVAIDRGDVAAAVEPRRVRLGITMSEASEDLVSHLGLPEGEYAVIDELVPGMPAALAGLQAKDLIVSIDGQTPASSEKIREVLGGKKLGDPVTLRVLRKGQQMDITANLNHVGSEKPVGQLFGGRGEGQAADARRFEDLANRFKELGRDAGKLGAEKGDEMGRDMEAWAERLAEEMKERFGDGEGLKFALPLGPDGKPGQMQMFKLPGGAREQAMEERLKQMESRLVQMEELLRRMEARLAAPSAPAAPTAP